MRYLPFVTICALAFLPSQVDGTFIIIGIGIFLIGRIFYTEERFNRDCNAIQEAGGINSTDEELCVCSSGTGNALTLNCFPLKEPICLTPPDVVFCTNSSRYEAVSSNRRPFAMSTIPSIVREEVRAEFEGPNNFVNSFYFEFSRGDGSTSSKKYTTCTVQSDAGRFVDCKSCEICDSGIDFKYDCSNTNGTYAFSDVTNTTILLPGPKVESCIPIADIVPSY